MFAKIERAQALRRIDAILAAADGVMVARGDLGVEIPIESIAAAQKQLLDKANRLAKPAITATQEAAVDDREPPADPGRGTDVANAILDGTDCVMVSEESAIGAYPVESVQMLSRIAKVTEPTCGRAWSRSWRPPMRRRDAGADGRERRGHGGARASGRYPRAVRWRHDGAPHRPLPPAGVDHRRSAAEATCQALQFVYGVEALHQTEPPDSWYVFARAHFGRARIRRARC